MGTGVSCAPDKGKPSIMLVWGRAIDYSRNQHKACCEGGVDHIIWEGISVKQSVLPWV